MPQIMRISCFPILLSLLGTLFDRIWGPNSFSDDWTVSVLLLMSKKSGNHVCELQRYQLHQSADKYCVITLLLFRMRGSAIFNVVFVVKEIVLIRSLNFVEYWNKSISSNNSSRHASSNSVRHSTALTNRSLWHTFRNDGMSEKYIRLLGAHYLSKKIRIVVQTSPLTPVSARTHLCHGFYSATP